MKKVRALGMWLLFLTKRLYKKPAFLGILIVIPLVIFTYSITAQQDSGMMTIVLATDAPENQLAQSLINELSNSSEVIRFITDKSTTAAEEMVHNGVADAAWIISPNIEQEIKEFVSGRYTGRGFVKVIVREETIPVLLTEEKLSGQLFICCARTCFIEHLRSNENVLSDLTDEQIGQYFDGISIDDDIFSYASMDSATDAEPKNYLLMPLRGILSILVIIAAMAAAIFYISDERNGLFSWINIRLKPFVEFGYQFIVVSNVMLFVLVSFIASGISIGLLREVYSALLYVICCSVFGQTMRLLCRNSKVIGMIMPILAMAMLVICPVFISLTDLKLLQLLFPPTYYLNGLYNSAYLAYMCVYIIVLCAFCAGISSLSKRTKFLSK